MLAATKVIAAVSTTVVAETNDRRMASPAPSRRNIDNPILDDCAHCAKSREYGWPPNGLGPPGLRRRAGRRHPVRRAAKDGSLVLDLGDNAGASKKRARL